MAQYASDSGNGKTAFNDVDQCLRYHFHFLSKKFSPFFLRQRRSFILPRKPDLFIDDNML